MHALSDHRRGFTVVEMLVTCGVLGTLVTLTAQILGAVALERRNVDSRACALLEASNILERMSLEDWDALTEPRLAERRLSADVAPRLPGGELKIELATSDDSPAAKQVAVTIRWRGAGGEFVRPVRLASWYFRPAVPSETEAAP